MNRDQQLMKHLRDQDSRALDEVIMIYGKYVFSIAYSIIGKRLSYEDAEEITSDVFWTLWEHAHDLDYIQYDSLKPYLAKITKNKSLMLLRKIQSYVFSEKEFELNDEIVISLNSLDDIYIQKELKQMLINVIEELGDPDCTIFLGYYFQCITIKEISKSLGLSESSIRMRLSRGRYKLKKILEERGYRYEIQNF